MKTLHRFGYGLAIASLGLLTACGGSDNANVDGQDGGLKTYPYE